MKYRIADESAGRIRIRIAEKKLNAEQAEILRYAFSTVKGVTKVRVYPATAGCAISYRCSRSEIIRKLNSFRFENVELLAEEEERQISAAEMKERKLAPELKHRLRMRILAETVADALLPMPVQIGYHVYQMVTLRNL